jgi:hypothetical protein
MLRTAHLHGSIGFASSEAARRLNGSTDYPLCHPAPRGPLGSLTRISYEAPWHLLRRDFHPLVNDSLAGRGMASIII